MLTRARFIEGFRLYVELPGTIDLRQRGKRPMLRRGLARAGPPQAGDAPLGGRRRRRLGGRLDKRCNVTVSDVGDWSCWSTSSSSPARSSRRATRAPGSPPTVWPERSRAAAMAVRQLARGGHAPVWTRPRAKSRPAFQLHPPPWPRCPCSACRPDAGLAPLSGTASKRSRFSRDSPGPG